MNPLYYTNCNFLHPLCYIYLHFLPPLYYKRVHDKTKSPRQALKWKELENRKPLLIRGARQVGKTTLVRTFAAFFPTFIELNLEREAERNLFELKDTAKLLNAIYLYKNVSNPK